MQPLIWEVWLFSPTHIRKEDQKQLTFTWSGQQDALIQYCLRAMVTLLFSIIIYFKETWVIWAIRTKYQSTDDNMLIEAKD